MDMYMCPLLKQSCVEFNYLVLLKNKVDDDINALIVTKNVMTKS